LYCALVPTAKLTNFHSEQQTKASRINYIYSYQAPDDGLLACDRK
jgi:hypothetical protein